ncbi:xanthine dehydrogenase family protein molybdopterin-binding subunit [Pseudonocardia sp. TRM90224]|uniref:xanthine dehydrogenase family protein molybdopterin-binding subunit n=1 Tax=Pseudonocardia sp. TRM90224 TaxID=2812678 RepID=UPI001E3BAA8D|nr:xanthine dehydrogenase family protein molybdopterin-binding subunit [Pseudonocardia sp. TRM90224]
MTAIPPTLRTERVDARDKVTGAVRYGTDRVPPGLLHAALAVATIAKGRVTSTDTAAAEAVPGVRLVLTRAGEGELASAGFLLGGGYGFQSLQPLMDDRIAYRGQPIAIVVADTPVAATEAAALVTATYETEQVSLDLDAEGVEVVEQAATLPPMFADLVAGDAEGTLADCDVRVEGTYDLPVQHQNPMELIGCVAEWEGDDLVVHEGSQNSGAIRHGLAAQLGIDAERIQVISPYVGGGFGQKNSLQPGTALAAIAARRTGRPVKLVSTRMQVFHNASFRPASRHRVVIGADRDGTMRAAVHEVDQQTSRHDLYPGSYTEITARLYGIPNFRGHQRLVRTDVQTPGYMRAPYEHPAAFAFESTVDDLAHQLGLDPVAMRLANDSTADPITGQPFSSRHVTECLRRGAERFGWERRTHEPGSMRAADGTRIGWGVALGAYKGAAVPAVARITASSDGGLRVEVGGHEMGQGIRTAVARTVALDLGVPAADISVVVGDTRSVPQHLTAGSWGTAGALPAVGAALGELRKALGLAADGPADVAAAVAATGQANVEVEATYTAPGQPPEIVLDRLRRGLPAAGGPVYPGFTAFSFVAHFVEVRIEPVIGRIRVPRVVSVADCGRVASPVTAASQLRGGVVWGIGAALREASEVDPRYGGFLNADLAEYTIPVNADIGDIDVDFIDVPDPLLNDIGVKGLGEVSMVGVAGAIGNAIFHATGKRFRHLPIRLDDLLG